MSRFEKLSHVLWHCPKDLELFYEARQTVQGQVCRCVKWQYRGSPPAFYAVCTSAIIAAFTCPGSPSHRSITTLKSGPFFSAENKQETSFLISVCLECVVSTRLGRALGIITPELERNISGIIAKGTRAVGPFCKAYRSCFVPKRLEIEATILVLSTA